MEVRVEQHPGHSARLMFRLVVHSQVVVAQVHGQLVHRSVASAQSVRRRLVRLEFKTKRFFPPLGTPMAQLHSRGIHTHTHTDERDEGERT